MTGLDELRDRDKMTWLARELGWLAIPEDVVAALSKDGFEECKREMTTSRRDLSPTGGVWQGINPKTGSVASVVWANRSVPNQSIVFVSIDGESLNQNHGGDPPVADDLYTDEGGEG